MKRTTIFIDERLERELQAIARRQGQPVASLVREAVERYVVAARENAPRRLGFVAVGRSGRTDIAEHHEEHLFEDEAMRPARIGRRRRRARPRRKATSR